jgi:hypothetical protein
MAPLSSPPANIADEQGALDAPILPPRVAALCHYLPAAVALAGLATVVGTMLIACTLPRTKDAMTLEYEMVQLEFGNFFMASADDGKPMCKGDSLPPLSYAARFRPQRAFFSAGATLTGLLYGALVAVWGTLFLRDHPLAAWAHRTPTAVGGADLEQAEEEGDDGGGGGGIVEAVGGAILARALSAVSAQSLRRLAVPGGAAAGALSSGSLVLTGVLHAARVSRLARFAHHLQLVFFAASWVNLLAIHSTRRGGSEARAGSGGGGRGKGRGRKAKRRAARGGGAWAQWFTGQQAGAAALVVGATAGAVAVALHLFRRRLRARLGEDEDGSHLSWVQSTPQFLALTCQLLYMLTLTGDFKRWAARSAGGADE